MKAGQGNSSRGSFFSSASLMNTEGEDAGYNDIVNIGTVCADARKKSDSDMGLVCCRPAYQSVYSTHSEGLPLGEPPDFRTRAGRQSAKMSFREPLFKLCNRKSKPIQRHRTPDEDEVEEFRSRIRRVA